MRNPPGRSNGTTSAAGRLNGSSAPRQPRERSRPAAPSASATAYARLRERIIACALAPGERLTESDVAEQMQLGKTPVREALRRLVHEGLVDVHPRKGYVVAPITLRDVEEICGLRLIVEPAAAALAAGRLDHARVATLEQLCHIGYDVTHPQSVRAFHRANVAFHTTIAEACGNQRLSALVSKLLVESHRIIQFGMLRLPHSDEAVRSHRALLRALRHGRVGDARRLVAHEIRATQQMVTESLWAQHKTGRLSRERRPVPWQ